MVLTTYVYIYISFSMCILTKINRIEWSYSSYAVYIHMMLFYFRFIQGAAHTPVRTSSVSYSRDGLDHIQPHLDGAVGVVGARLGQPAHTVVTVAQDLNPQTVVLLRDIGEDSVIIRYNTNITDMKQNLKTEYDMGYM